MTVLLAALLSPPKGGMQDSGPVTGRRHSGGQRGLGPSPPLLVMSEPSLPSGPVHLEMPQLGAGRWWLLKSEHQGCSWIMAGRISAEWLSRGNSQWGAGDQAASPMWHRQKVPSVERLPMQTGSWEDLGGAVPAGALGRVHGSSVTSAWGPCGCRSLSSQGLAGWDLLDGRGPVYLSRFQLSLHWPHRSICLALLSVLPLSGGFASHLQF